jgi:diguanylate cyclase (GGDEF)-like protein
VLLSDNAFKRKLAKLALKALGVRVTEAGAAASARRAVIEDIGMQSCTAVVVALRDFEGDGVEACRTLRAAFEAEAPNGDQPAIALVVERRDEAARRRAANAGVDFALIEPVDWGALLETLESRSEADAPSIPAPTQPDSHENEPRKTARIVPNQPLPFELTDELKEPAKLKSDPETRSQHKLRPSPHPAQLSPTTAPAQPSNNGELGPSRFMWRPTDGAFRCGSSAVAALGGSPTALPRTLENWVQFCVTPRPEIIKAALEVAARETGETLLIGAFQAGRGPRGNFALFAERRYDDRDRAYLSGVAHLASAWGKETERDSLTGFYTVDGLRPPMTALLNRAIAERRKCAAYALEISDFFEVDDSFGAEGGDQTLEIVSERMRETLRTGDLLARIGRAMFLIVQPDVKNLDDVKGLGARLIASLTQPIDIVGVNTRLRIAIGAAIGPDHADNAAALASAAETARKEASQKGVSNMHIYGSLASDPARERSTLRREVQTALMDGAFQLHFMPGVDNRGAVTCLEALLRLRRGDRWMSPDDVVDIAEQSGDVRAFMRRIFQMAADDLALWRHTMAETPILAVNLTGAALAEGEAIEEAERALCAIEVGLSGLRIETTDRRLERRRAQAVSALAAAKQAGVEIALDDFGTRASSIDAIASFPYDRVKIARALVGRTPNRGEPDLFAAAVMMARDAGLRAAANGVADQNLRQRAFQLGCDEAQGYAIAPPAPMPELVGWFARARCGTT